MDGVCEHYMQFEDKRVLDGLKNEWQDFVAVKLFHNVD